MKFSHGIDQDDENFEKKLWKSIDSLRGHIDTPEYKFIVLGLIFLKNVSCIFQEQYKKFTGASSVDPEDSNLYLSVNTFWIPPAARWETIQSQAMSPYLGKSINDAMMAIQQENSSLRGIIPIDYATQALNQRQLGELVLLVGDIDLGCRESSLENVYGRIFEYFLKKFADTEGKRGGEFHTPGSIANLLVSMIKPKSGHIYDPCCGSGGMFVQTKKFLDANGENTKDVSFYGQEANLTAWRLAKVNLAVHGIEADLGYHPSDTFHYDIHRELKADFILANPPFNTRDWGGGQLYSDPRWKYGLPPMKNANFAWLQHIVYHMATDSIAGVIMTNSSLFSKQRNERETRQAIIEENLVDCIVALPSQLFYGTSIPASLWILAKNKEGRQNISRSRDTLFIDARELGRVKDPIHREFSRDEISQIINTYHSWRGEKNLDEYQDITGFCKSVSIDTIAFEEYNLSPDRYVEPIGIGERLIRQLNSIPVGQKDATDYQQLVFEILNYLFDSELIDGELEVKTYEGTERRDIIYTNDAEKGFWEYIRIHHGCLFVVFEAKNVEKLEVQHINQISNYIGVRLGLFGFIVTRNAAGYNITLKTYSVYNDTPGSIRKTILVLSDEDLKIMLHLKQRSHNPTQHIQKMYRKFITQLQ